MRDEHPVEYYMYKPITENPIVIDFSKVRYYDELYELLKKKFGLPDYCGHNLNAIWDCMRYMWDADEWCTVELHGVFSIREDLQPDLDGILKIFNDIHEESSGVVFISKS